jgi:cell pole-organizing protein PopZ
MSQTAKVQEPSMEEILASIRRIIADDDAGKPAKPAEPAAPKPAAAVPPPPPPTPTPRPAPAPAGNSQDEVDAMLADLDVQPKPLASKPAAAPPPPPPPPKPAETAPPADVLDLTEAMTAPPPPPAPSFRTIDAAADVVFSDRAPEPPAEPVTRSAEETRPAPAQNAAPERALLSSTTVAAVDSAFNSLAHTVLGNNARTLEDLVKEMLQPMLKTWLDDNLPGLVERIVRAEIERVSRGR